MNPERLVLLDIDGTILLTAGAGRRAITAALGEHVGEVSSFQHMRFDGKTDPQIVGEMLAMAGHEPPHDDERVAALCRRYVALLERELASGASTTTLMPGIERLLIRLAGEQRVALGLLTGNLVDGAELKLRAAGIDSRQFVVGAYGSDSHDRCELPAIAAARARPLFGHIPSGDEVIIIGDTPADITCGRNIGARAIAVATGAYSIEDLGAHRPWAVLPDLSDTEAVMAAILG